jgi:membrane fusion protein, copper/silver efflux system
MRTTMRRPLTLILSPKRRGRGDRICSPLPCRVRERVRVRVLFLAAIVSLAGLTAGCSKSDQHSTTPSLEHPAVRYHCPMHPTVVSDKPGDCPICGMKLVRIGDGQTESSAPETKAPPGLATIAITPEIRQRMGLTLGTVEKRPLAREIRTSARIVPDETRLYHVTLKTEGWIEHFHTIFVGKFIRKGEPLMNIYSPELLTAQREFLNATQTGDSNLVIAARHRLELLDLTDQQIAELQKAGRAERTATLYAPASGYVTERNIAAGHKVMPGEMLLTLADLSVVWADADIYESDLPFVKEGMAVELSVAFLPDKKFTGKVTFITPTLDPASRTIKARMEIPNPDQLLKPEMFATARLTYDLGEKLAIPAAAVLRTGESAYAFRDGDAGHLTPLEIKLGARSGEWFELLSGLEAGDRVVTSANFLVDSESQLKAALAGMQH